jgi:TDG/mug DNA glycosylase family protein
MSDMLPDVLAQHLSVIFCGINPASTAAAAGRHFVSPSNRFWRVLHLAGFTPSQIRPEDDRTILHHGCGLTTAVARPTRQAGDLSRKELRQAASTLKAKVEYYAPRVIAFLGKAAYAAMMENQEIAWGLQPLRFGGATAWVLPNHSGLNRNFSLSALVTAYAELNDALRAENDSRLQVAGACSGDAATIRRQKIKQTKKPAAAAP